VVDVKVAASPIFHAIFSAVTESVLFSHEPVDSSNCEKLPGELQPEPVLQAGLAGPGMYWGVQKKPEPGFEPDSQKLSSLCPRSCRW